jgi:phosphatidylcholine synthase
MVVVFAILQFVPIKYLYPSRTKKFMKLNILNTVVFLVSNFALLVLIEWKYDLPTALVAARVGSVLSFLYFGGMSVYHTWFDPDTKDI